MESISFSLAITTSYSSWTYLLLISAFLLLLLVIFFSLLLLINSIDQVKMAQSCVKVARTNNLKNLVNRRVLILRRFTRILLNRIVPCTPGKSQSYLLLSRAATPSPSVSRSLPPPVVDGEVARRTSVHDLDSSNRRSDSDLVSLKISLLGDPDTGKTCFLVSFYLLNTTHSISLGHYWLISHVRLHWSLANHRN